jgi:hypothetical protein
MQVKNKCRVIKMCCGGKKGTRSQVIELPKMKAA